jgi:hypothetical protein
MSEHSAVDIEALWWLAGWLVAVALLTLAALRLPLQLRTAPTRGRVYSAAVLVAAAGAGVLAVVALTLHDAHIDLTRDKAYTPSSQAMQVVDRLDRPVALTYFYRSQDPEGRRTRDLLTMMGRRNALLQVKTIDPDKEPTLAQAYGVRLYNAGVLEAEGRRLLVNTTDEAEIAIGIQRVLRQRTVTVCFLEGHNELPMDNFEFHTHLEGVSGHSHGDASSKLVQTTGHGAGRLRRALEGQGYEVHKLVLATLPGVPPDCAVVISVNPRTTFLPAESAALDRYLRDGGSALFLLDLGFSLEPGFAALLQSLGVRPEQKAVVDPLSHYYLDPEMVAVAGYDPHPITRSVSMTYFPGVRPLAPVTPAAGVHPVAIVASSRDSYSRRVAAVESREVNAAPATARSDDPAGPRVLAVAAEGTLPGSQRAFRAIVTGDGDFASNSFFPYMANSDLALSMVRWLVHEDQSTAVASRIPVPSSVMLSSLQMRGVFLGIVVALPLAPIAVGTMVWWRRR